MILNSMAPIKTRIILVFCLVLGLAPACKDSVEGPKSPDASILSAEQNSSGETVRQTPDDLSPAEPDEGAQPAIPATDPLPAIFLSGVTECKKQGRYYDLQIASCTETPLADFPCDLIVLLSEASAVLNANQKELLKEHIEKNLLGFSLFACTIDKMAHNLHFYKVEADKIRANNVTITGGTQ